MKVTICRCYYDLANLYGDNGNISVLRDYLREQGAEVVIEKPTVGDPMNFDEYDFIYIGSMTEGNFAIVAEDFAGKAEQLKRAVENGKRVLLTGNAGELLGQTIIVNGRETEGSGILGFTVSPLASRHMGEIILKDDEDREIIGFQNRANQILNNPYPWLEVVQGMGDNPSCQREGIRYRNLRSTYTVAPFLARNYFLCERLAKELIEEKGGTWKPMDHSIDQKAYESFRKELHTEGTVEEK